MRLDDSGPLAQAILDDIREGQWGLKGASSEPCDVNFSFVAEMAKISPTIKRSLVTTSGRVFAGAMNPNHLLTSNSLGHLNVVWFVGSSGDRVWLVTAKPVSLLSLI